MKKLTTLTLGLILITSSVYAESFLPDYGYYQYQNEISAKDEIIPHVNNIFDFDKTANPGGEKIEHGKYFMDVKYLGTRDQQGAIDTDYIYLEDLFQEGQSGADGVNGKDGKIPEEKIKQIEKNTTNINNLFLESINNQSVNNLDNRLSELEATQYIVEGQIRHVDTKKWKVKSFVAYSTNRNRVDRVGIKFTFKMGSSFEERRIKELEEKIERLLK